MTPASGGRAATRPVRTGGAALRSHVPLAPRRVSGPVKRPRDRSLTRPPGRPREPARGRVRLKEPLPTRAAHALAAFLRSLPDHRWLDRLVRGRAWIPLLGVLLAGIVATQVEVLKLGASMGRWVSRTAALTSRNQALQASVAGLSNDQRIEGLAGQMGMVMPEPTDVTFLALGPTGGIRAAIGRIHAPDATLFQGALSASQAAALAQETPTTVAPATGTLAPSTQPATSIAPTTSSTPTAPTTSATAVQPTSTSPATLPAQTAAGTTTTTTSTQPPVSDTQTTGGAAPPTGAAGGG